VRLVEDFLVDCLDEAVVADEVGAVAHEEDVALANILGLRVLVVDRARDPLLRRALDFPVGDVAGAHEGNVTGAVGSLADLVAGAGGEHAFGLPLANRFTYVAVGQLFRPLRQRWVVVLRDVDFIPNCGGGLPVVDHRLRAFFGPSL